MFEKMQKCNGSAMVCFKQTGGNAISPCSGSLNAAEHPQSPHISQVGISERSRQVEQPKRSKTGPKLFCEDMGLFEHMMEPQQRFSFRKLHSTIVTTTLATNQQQMLVTTSFLPSQEPQVFGDVTTFEEPKLRVPVLSKVRGLSGYRSAHPGALTPKCRALKV